MKEGIRRVLRRIGIEVVRYRVQTSSGAHLQCLLQYCHIDLVLDVGANRGQYASELRAHGYRGHIVSFEPLASAYLSLVKAVGSDPHWVVAPRMALGDADGEIDVHVAGNSSSSSVLDMLPLHEDSAPGSGFVGREIVKLCRLDKVATDYMASSKSVLLKIDTQGYEDRVLNGAAGIMDVVAAIQVELSMVPLYAGQLLFDAMRQKIESLGYVLFAIFPAFVHPGTGQTLQVDGFFVRRSLLGGQG